MAKKRKKAAWIQTADDRGAREWARKLGGEDAVEAFEQASYGAYNPNIVTGKADVIITTFFPTKAQNLFPATITDYSDSYSSQWEEQSAYGFQDNVAILQGTTRVIRVSFVIANEGAWEAEKYTKRLNKIVQNLYPAYDSSTGQPQGTPLFGLKVMNWTQNKHFNRLYKEFYTFP